VEPLNQGISDRIIEKGQKPPNFESNLKTTFGMAFAKFHGESWFFDPLSFFKLRKKERK